MYICLSRPAGGQGLESVRTGRGLLLHSRSVATAPGEDDPSRRICCWVGRKAGTNTGLFEIIPLAPMRTLKNPLLIIVQSNLSASKCCSSMEADETSRICISVRCLMSLLPVTTALPFLLKCARHLMKRAIHEATAWNVSFSSLLLQLFVKVQTNTRHGKSQI